MRRFALRRAAALVPVAALGLATLSFTSPASAVALPKLDVGDVTVVEGNGGTANTMKFPVTLSEPAGADVLVQWSITPGTATPGVDYVALKKPKVTTIKAGKTAAFASVKDIPDTGAESDETFTVHVESVSGPAELGSHPDGHGTIVDDDGTGDTYVSVGDASAIETDTGLPKVALPFTLSSPLAVGEVDVTWTVTPGTASAGTDYKAPMKPKLTRIKAGKTSAQATTPVYGDTSYESDETFTVTITNVTVVGEATSVGVLRSIGTGTIVNDDPPPTPPEAPTNVVASLNGTTGIDVSWSAPATGPAPTQYDIESSNDGGATWNPEGSVAAPTTSTSFTFAPGTYRFRVTAENVVGPSSPSDPSNDVIVPIPVAPGAPSNVVASLTPDPFVHVTWDAPTTGDAPTQYNLEYSTDGGVNWINLGSTSPSPTDVTIDMAPGTYIIHVQGENGGGAGPWSDPSNEVTVPDPVCDPFCSG